MKASETFALLERCAIADERCPMSKPHGPLESAVTCDLARVGKIRIEVFEKNYRVVTILTGPHAGKQTKAAPAGKQPYRIVTRQTYLDKEQGWDRPGPSAPRRIA